MLQWPCEATSVAFFPDRLSGNVLYAISIRSLSLLGLHVATVLTFLGAKIDARCILTCNGDKD